MKKTKLERYHEDYVSQRRVERVVAVTPEAMEIESRAIERERRGHYQREPHPAPRLQRDRMSRGGL